MRRDDRAVTDLAAIYDILQRCDTLSLGMNGGETPYVIPMTFGCELKDGQIIVYIHSAGEGRKCDLLAENNNVCVEAHLYYKVALEGGGITAKYESVIGTGKAVRLTEQAEKVAAFKIMLAHYNNTGFPVTSCKGLTKAEVYKITLTEVSGKHNL